jgi:hypothetical protein
LDYENFRTDVDHGTKIGDGLLFMWGFYRTGEGVRKQGLIAMVVQVKFNITKEFEKDQ